MVSPPEAAAVLSPLGAPMSSKLFAMLEPDVEVIEQRYQPLPTEVIALVPFVTVPTTPVVKLNHPLQSLLPMFLNRNQLVAPAFA